MLLFLDIVVEGDSSRYSVITDIGSVTSPQRIEKLFKQGAQRNAFWSAGSVVFDVSAMNEVKVRVLS